MYLLYCTYLGRDVREEAPPLPIRYPLGTYLEKHRVLGLNLSTTLVSTSLSQLLVVLSHPPLYSFSPRFFHLTIRRKEEI